MVVNRRKVLSKKQLAGIDINDCRLPWASKISFPASETKNLLVRSEK